jgi:hypothetical protein
MKIDIEKEVKELTVELRPADGYLECENTIITHIKKHIRNGISILDTESYLKELVICFEDRMLTKKADPDNINYIYATSCLKTITTTPFWQSWINKDI